MVMKVLQLWLEPNKLSGKETTSSEASEWKFKSLYKHLQRSKPIEIQNLLCLIHPCLDCQQLLTLLHRRSIYAEEKTKFNSVPQAAATTFAFSSVLILPLSFVWTSGNKCIYSVIIQLLIWTENMGSEPTILFFVLFCFFVSGVGFPLYPEIFYFNTMILQRIRTIVGDAGFEHGTSATEVWCATNEPPHLQLLYYSYQSL